MTTLNLLKVTYITISKKTKVYILFFTKTMLKFILIQINLNYTHENLNSQTSLITKNALIT